MRASSTRARRCGGSPSRCPASAESRGRDVRALVVGERVVGAMRREARKGEFRSNLHRGGFGSAVQLPHEYAEAAVRAARVLGLDVAGVYLLESDQGPTVLELNS